MSRRVLVVEDDEAIREGVVDALALAGFEALTAADAASGRALMRRLDLDAVLLDLILPGGDGLELLREVRALRPTLPVIITTARGAEAQRIRGLELGADDYVVKPYSVRELLARLEAVLRRSPGRVARRPQRRFAGGLIDFEDGELRFEDGERVTLTEREVELLRYLADHEARAVGRDELLQNVWRIDPQGSRTRAVDMQVKRLRDKLRDDGAEPAILVTLRGRGLRFVARPEGEL